MRRHVIVVANKTEDAIVGGSPEKASWSVFEVSTNGCSVLALPLAVGSL